MNREEMTEALLDNVDSWSISELVELAKTSVDEYLDTLNDDQLLMEYEAVIGKEGVCKYNLVIPCSYNQKCTKDCLVYLKTI